jgi:hypothetical protein
MGLHVTVLSLDTQEKYSVSIFEALNLYTITAEILEYNNLDLPPISKTLKMTLILGLDFASGLHYVCIRGGP